MWPRLPPEPGLLSDAGRRVGAETRAAMLLRFHDLVLDRQSDLLDLIQWESGKSRKHAFEEVAHIAMTARYYGRLAPGLMSAHRARGIFPILTRVDVLRQPKGLVGVISPWNYPLSLAVCDLIPALLAGNAVVLKPDTQTALTALRARELLVEAGLPEEVWQVVVGEPDVVGQPLLDEADHVCFTGSTAAGRRIAEAAARRLIGVTLELGGKNPMLVLDDADVAKAARGAMRACFANAGQLCLSMERIYVADKVYDEFVAKLVAETKSLKLATGYGYNYDMGSLTSKRPAGHRQSAGGGRAGAGRDRAGRREGPTRSRPVLLRADRVAGRRRRHGAVRQRDVRPGRLGVSGRGRRRGRATGQRHRVRPERERVDAQRGTRSRGRVADPVRHGEHQRGLQFGVRIQRRADGWDEGVRARAGGRDRRVCCDSPRPRRSRRSACCRLRRRSACPTPASRRP